MLNFLTTFDKQFCGSTKPGDYYDKFMVLSCKTRMTENKSKPKQSSTEWALHNTVNIYKDDQEFGKVVQLAKIACFTPVTNAWPETGASAIKRIEPRTRSTMTNDLLNALLQISISGPEMNSSDADKLIENASLNSSKHGQIKSQTDLL